MATIDPGDVEDDGVTPTFPTTGQRGRIMVIDDELLLGRTLRFAFQEDHDVVVVTSGREAFARLATDKAFDLILCDLMMPDMTGMAVYSRMLVEHPKLAGRLVFMTGGAFTDAAREFLDNHPGAQLQKPFDISTVEALLRHRLALPRDDRTL